MNSNMGLSFLYADYLKGISEEQELKFKHFKELCIPLNEYINLISRKAIPHFEIRHVLHYLAIARFIQFNPGAVVLDVGTGGGFPGIPLAIYFPQTKFILTDSIEKKIKALRDMVDILKLDNVEVVRSRAEEMSQNVDYVVSRAVAPLPELVNWTKKLLVSGQKGSLPNGWVVLKGGDLTEELFEFRKDVEIQKISDWWSEDFFETKAVVYLARQIII